MADDRPRPTRSHPTRIHRMDRVAAPLLPRERGRMTPPVILGVDPGLSGAIAALDASSGALLWAEDIPNGAGRINAAALADLLVNEIAVAAYVEDVHSMPRQGVSTTF